MINKMLDLCCGLKGASKEFEKAGWDITTVDIEQKFSPSIIADVNTLHLESPGEYKFIWASPPCPEYSKMGMPLSWHPERKQPDMRMFLNCYRIIRYLNPQYWIIENVRGAIPYFSLVLGDPIKKVNSRILWGNVPIFDTRDSGKGNKWRLPPTEDRPAIRSQIPKGISLAIQKAIGMSSSREA